jgi:hypothetical protein
MSTVPSSLKELQGLLRDRTGLKPVSLGVVGNAKHKSGYHLGRDRIFGPIGQGQLDYSVKTARDRTSLTDDASAIDIGNFARLHELGRWIVRQARAGAEDTKDIREVIYSPDGQTVFRWDRQNGQKSVGHKGEADNSHRTHTHVSWYRDSANRDKTAIFVRFFDLPNHPTAKIVPSHPANGGDPVNAFSTPPVPSVCTIAKGVRLFTSSDLKTVAFNIDPGRDMPFLGQPIKGVGLIHRTDEAGKPTGKVFFARMQDVNNVRPAP